jgi:hypothetical protein
MSKPNPLDNYQNKADEKYSEASESVKKRAAVILKEELNIINRSVKSLSARSKLTQLREHSKWMMIRRRKYIANI